MLVEVVDVVKVLLFNLHFAEIICRNEQYSRLPKVAGLFLPLSLPH